MHRRTFLQTGTLAGLSLAVLPLVSCNNHSGNTKEQQAHFPLQEMTIREMQAKMESGELSAEEITQLYLDRIKETDNEGPMLKSVIEINPDALSIAQTMDKERKQGKLRGPLHGIPILLKDNIDTADKMQTTAGSLALAGHIAQQDAFIVAKLRAAGAIILGKTNLSEWANFRSTRSVSGWSSRGGQTKNPYILDRSPCGSSSGSAVAVSANLCAVAVGTETDGSIACPASMNGIVGIKPTVGLVSRTGIIPISKTQDTAGPFGRTVMDAAILLSVLTVADEKDSAPQYVPFVQEPNRITPEMKGVQFDFTQFLNMNGLQGKRIGIEKSMLKKHEAIDTLVQKAIGQLTQAGATVVEVELMKMTQAASAGEFTVLEYEFKDGLNKYLATAGSNMKSLEDIIRFNKANEVKAMPYFKQEIMDSSQAKGDLNSKEYLDALAKSLSSRKAIDDLLQAENLDAICGPATGTAWCTDPINGDFWTGYGAYGPAAMAGYPSITVPMGFVDALPVGLSFLGTAYSEPILLSIAYAYEQVAKNRKAPQFKEHV